MELEVGMYVRTLNGIIKIDKIQNNLILDTKGYLHYGDFIKAGHSLLGNNEEHCLIEEDDYVNGDIVTKIKKDEQNNKYIVTIFNDVYYDKDIKSIVTREQFEAMAYKVGE